MRLVLGEDFPTSGVMALMEFGTERRLTGVSPASFKRACTRSPTAQIYGLSVRAASALTAWRDDIVN